MRKLVCFVMVMLVVLSVAGCGTQPVTEKKEFKVGFVNLTNEHVFWNTVQESFENYGNEIGLDVSVVDGRNDTNVQYDEVQNFITQGVDAIVISPADTGSSGAAELAKSAGIPIFYQNIVGSGDYAGFVITNEIQGGNNAGKWAMEYINENLDGKANCAIITFDEISQCVDRATGFKDIVLKNKDVKILAEQTYSGDTEKAAAITQDFLTQFPELDIIFAVGDPAAQGALEVIKAQGADTIVIGYDANPEAYATIKNETDGAIWKADVAQDPVGCAKMMLDLIKDYLNGKEIIKENYMDTYIVDLDYINKK